ncbi:pimeloyl-ACP methyl ester carboxylesterase [Nocardioides cavernae]|uniref:Pimeloyl-ACP methyl ester carboxylesterase n=1 Tax=Nocardioides cavernae TaxID=1921566 RepID=A0A7Y9KSH0_9ACTN|nr:alpha/beta fold hydrolase [Nocardioides cavernae]NYE37604.1 pimeloyl-ACP methyl ester carboxylesterase [Nocardioides cavernae]
MQTEDLPGSHPDPHPSDWRQWSVRGDGVDLAVREVGDPAAPAVVLVHGWPDTHRLWLPLAGLLAADLRVVVYDTRGMGLSTCDAPASAFALPRLAADLMAVVDDASPDRPAHVVGHDWGSVQAWEAVCEPGADERIASFTSLSGPNLDHVSAWVRRTVRRPSAVSVASLVGQAMSSSYVPFLVSPLAPPVLRWAAGPDAASGLRYYRGNLHAGVRPPRERRTRVPVLQVALTRDPAIREGALAASDPWCEDLRRVHLPAGHWAPRTHAPAVAEAVRDHVAYAEHLLAGAA